MSFKINGHGSLVWTDQSGILHRENGPALISIDGYISYRSNGFSHRLDGPATIYSCGSKYYHIDGIKHTKEDYWSKVKKL